MTASATRKGRQLTTFDAVYRCGRIGQQSEYVEYVIKHPRPLKIVAQVSGRDGAAGAWWFVYVVESGRKGAVVTVLDTPSRQLAVDAAHGIAAAFVKYL